MVEKTIDEISEAVHLIFTLAIQYLRSTLEVPLLLLYKSFIPCVVLPSFSVTV